MLLKRLLYITIPAILVLSGCTANKIPSPKEKDVVVIKAEEKKNIGKKWADKTNIKSVTESNVSSENVMSKNKQVRIPFPNKEYSKLSKKGRATVKGKIYLDNNYGTKIYGKNTRLYLNPVTSYSKTMV